MNPLLHQQNSFFYRSSLPYGQFQGMIPHPAGSVIYLTNLAGCFQGNCFCACPIDRLLSNSRTSVQSAGVNASPTTGLGRSSISARVNKIAAARESRRTLPLTVPQQCSEASQPHFKSQKGSFSFRFLLAWGEMLGEK